MRLARLRRGINLFMGPDTCITPRGTTVQVYDKPPFCNAYLCNIPGYSRARGIAIYNLEFLDESN